MNPIIITSEKATKDLARIKLRHADILTGLQNQRQKVEMYKQTKEMQKKEQTMQDAETTKQKTESDHKKRELDIKQQALMST